MRRALSFAGFFLLSNFAYAQRPPLSSPIQFLSYVEVDYVRSGARPGAMGRAFIGAAIDDNAVIYNPAGTTYLNRTTVAAGMRFFGYHERFGARDGDGDFTVGVVVPIKKFSFTFAFYYLFNDESLFEVPQLVTIDSDLSTRQVLGGLGNFPGKRVRLHLQVPTFNLSSAYQLHKRLSVAFTLHGYLMDFEMLDRTYLDPALTNGKQVPRGLIAQTTYSIADVDVRRGPLWAGGASLMTNPIQDRLFLGATYSRGATYKDFQDSFLPEYTVGSQTFESEIQRQNFQLKFPDTYGVGFYYRAHPRLNLTFDIFRIEYSDFLSGNDLNAASDDEFDQQTQRYRDPDGRPDLTIDDVTEFHIGLEWLINVATGGFLLPLRFGFYTDPGNRLYAVSDDPNLQRLYPKADDRVHFTLGSGIVFKNGKFDMAYDYSEGYQQLFFSWVLTVQ